MYVRRFRLTNFRNYRELDLELSPGHLLFTGDNAQGKSNLLEAAYLLTSGRSVRAGQDAETIGWDLEADIQPFARLGVEVERREGAVMLEAIIAGPSLTPGVPGRAGKRFRVNGIARRLIDFAGQMRSVLFTADDLEIISGPPATRRAYLDAALTQFDRGYHGALQRYGRIMQQRNATLRRIKEGIAGLDELALWDDGFSREGATIIAARHSAVRDLSMLAAEAHVRLTSGAPEALQLAYEPALGEQWRDRLPPEPTTETVQPILAAALASQRRRETGAGISLLGPHRDNMTIRLNGFDAASYGSRAQIRTATLSLRLAEAELLRAGSDDPPVLLLDDILSEMDARRRDSVLAALTDFDQVWYTATTGSLLPEGFLATATQFTVENGSISQP